MNRFLASLAWQDLRASGHSLWVFCVCLMLGVTLLAATGGLYRQVSDALLSDTRALMGGDLEVEARQPLPGDVLGWMRDRGAVSLLTEMRTMLATQAEEFHVVEVQSVDGAYPLYGELTLEPAMDLRMVTAFVDGRWGLAMDHALAGRLAARVGETVEIGTLTLEIRALIRHQPDRSLRADWRGAPVLVAAGALAESGLVTEGSRIEYEYRVRTDSEPDTWREEFYAAFPEGEWEVRTFMDRSERIAETLGQVASGLLIIGFSTLFIGGLGVFNSIQAYLQRKLATIATLRALGLRNRRLATVYLLQVGMLAGGSSVAGAIAGYGLALIGAGIASARFQLVTEAASVGPALLMAVALGMATAFTFAMPAIGRALSIDPAALFRRIHGATTRTPREWWLAAAAGCGIIVSLTLIALPDPVFGLGFVGVTGLLLFLLDRIERLLRRLSYRLEDHPVLEGHLALRLATANIRQAGSPLRAILVSLGSALTLLVACAIVVGALVREINHTIPDEAPSLVLYDIAAGQLEDVVRIAGDASDSSRLDTAPLVLGRLTAVNGEALRDSADDRTQHEARDEHKLTYRANNIDNVTLDRGAWWSENGDPGRPRVAMEDREADQLGLEVGDRLTFSIAGADLTADLNAIYRQKGLQTRFWFEAIFSAGALDPFIHRYVGAAYLDDDTALTVQRDIGRAAPNVVTVRTATIIETARDLLGKAVAGLGVIALVSLGVSLLVLTGVVATSRTRQVYDATILHSLGARLTAIRSGLRLEYLLLALITSVFATIMGSMIAIPLLVYRLKLPADVPLFWGVMVAIGVSVSCLYFGARYLLKRLQLNPALLLRNSG